MRAGAFRAAVEELVTDAPVCLIYPCSGKGHRMSSITLCSCRHVHASQSDVALSTGSNRGYTPLLLP